jgi:hypothetical protein
VRRLANSTGGYAKGNMRFFLELSPSTSLERSAKSGMVPVTAGERYYFAVDCQRGTTLGLDRG